MKPADLFKKFSIPKVLVPAKIQRDMDISLARANISFSGAEWMGIFTVIGFILFGIGTLLSSIFSGLALFVVVIIAMFVLPRVQADRRKGAIEEALPDALHHMSVAIRTGLVLESVIQEISESEYGPLSDEFAQIMVEMRRGRPLKGAMYGFAKRAGSKQVERAMHLLLEGVESGGPISDVLDEVSDDMRAVRMIQRERKSSTSQQTSFLAMASLMAGPFVMGVVGALPTVMQSMAAGLGPTLPLDQINKVVTALTFYVVAQACSAALMIAVVMYGDFKKGFKFMIPMGLIAYGVFALIRHVMPGLVTAF
jgi:flagellar protein FlaJ